MRANYLGMPIIDWALLVWLAIASTFGVILFYRVLIKVKERDELFVGPAELRRANAHLKDVDRCAKGFGIASAVLLLAIVVSWIVGLS